MNGDQFGSIRKGGLDLDVCNHLRDAVHDVRFGQKRSALTHQLGHGFTVSCALHDRSTVVGHRLRIVEFLSPGLSPLSQKCGGEDQEFVFFAGR